MKKIIFLLILIILPVTVNAARGCCSHHGGVSHCGSSGKYICNDGSTSPSCTCNYTYKPSTNNTTSNNTSPVQEELKEEQVKEEDQPKLIINKNNEIIENTEENEEGSLLELLPIAIPGSIAAIAYEKSRKKN